MDRLIFEKDGHIYLLDGKRITGVTTILGVINKPALLNWAAGCAVDFIATAQSLNADILKDARTAYAQKRDKAGDIGTLAHETIAKYIQNKIADTNSAIAIPESVAPMYFNFVKWAEDNKVKFLSSEQRVYSEKNWYCGTYDFDCEIDGKIYLGDLKTSSGIYPEMFYQTAAYQNAIQEMAQPNEVPIAGNIIVNCRKDGKFDCQMTEEYEQNLKAFMGALAIYRRQQELNN